MTAITGVTTICCDGPGGGGACPDGASLSSTWKASHELRAILREQGWQTIDPPDLATRDRCRRCRIR
jgi:hypothetical protein